ncbi:hypothetical protein WA026_002271, partial [Henosepilachna vigintioctopunctata]
NTSKFTQTICIYRQRTTTSDLGKLYKRSISKCSSSSTKFNSTENITGTPILISEVEYAVANLKDGKTPGEDMIHAEVLKLMDPKILCNKIYGSVIIPTGWLRSIFIALPKKNKA